MASSVKWSEWNTWGQTLPPQGAKVEGETDSGTFTITSYTGSGSRSLWGISANRWRWQLTEEEEPLPLTQRDKLQGDPKETNPKQSIGVRKVPASVLPQNVLGEVALGLLEGACKYGRHNYRVAGTRASTYYDGTRRHLDAWWEGQDVDPDSNLSHVTKAIASLVVLRDSMLRGMMTDDRPPRSADDWITDLNAKAAEILDRHPDKKEAFTERTQTREEPPQEAPHQCPKLMPCRVCLAEKAGRW